jgi:hypothetical protein
MNNDYDIILMCALRYAFGRKTYVVSTVMNAIRKYVKDNPSMREKFINEIQRLIDEPLRYLSKKEWEDFVKEL